MKYLAYYDIPENKEQNRSVALSAVSKISYINQVLEHNGETVEIVSASMTENRKGCKGSKQNISDSTVLTLFSCWGKRGRIQRLLRRILFQTKLFLYLLLHIQKNEKVFVYHSVAYAGMVSLLKRLRKFKLILEVEEIYADVNGVEKDRKKEHKVFAVADGYLFSADRLNKVINTENKPCAILYGTYKTEPGRNCRFEEEKLRGKIHCVYAGTFDPRKGGGMLAAQAAAYLPEQYHLHILGFGTPEQVQDMEKLVEQLSQQCLCGISYDGCLTGEEYIRFLQCCQIGLSTQNPSGSYNDTSFPSKILSYMANGLQVVTVRIPVVEESAVGSWMNYYDEQSPGKIAEAIKNVQISPEYDSRKTIAELDRKFTEEIRKLLEDRS